MRKVLFILTSFMLLGCTREPEFPTTNETNEPQARGFVGEKLEDPYTVENMRKAYESLRAQTRSQAPDLEIKATHLYVKFIPKTEGERDLLSVDEEMVIYPYPLDHKIEVTGDMALVDYRDPSVPEGQPTYQYAAVRVDKKLPDNIEYVILKELFIPEESFGGEDGATTRSGQGTERGLTEDFARTLTAKSMELTGNAEPGTRASGRWRPQGRITYLDEYYPNIRWYN